MSGINALVDMQEALSAADAANPRSKVAHHEATAVLSSALLSGVKHL